MLHGDAVEPNELETVEDTETAAGRQSLLLRDDQRQRDSELGHAHRRCRLDSLADR